MFSCDPSFVLKVLLHFFILTPRNSSFSGSPSYTWQNSETFFSLRSNQGILTIYQFIFLLSSLATPLGQKLQDRLSGFQKRKLKISQFPILLDPNPILSKTSFSAIRIFLTSSAESFVSQPHNTKGF